MSLLNNGILNLPAIPTDALIECMETRGDFPRRIALSYMHNPQLRLEATIFYFDCIEADNGDSDAKNRIDYIREKCKRYREAERVLGNDPALGAVNPRGRVGMPEPITAPLRHRGKIPTKAELRKISEKGRRRPLRLILPPGVRAEG